MRPDYDRLDGGLSLPVEHLVFKIKNIAIELVFARVDLDAILGAVRRRTMLVFISPPDVCPIHDGALSLSVRRGGVSVILQ